MKILIIEDEPSLREVMQRALEQERYIVETAATYAEADARIAAYSYDCILLDIMLPDGSGCRLLEHIKHLRRRDNVIIISARDSLDDKVEGLELGADDYLPKPFSHAQLTARVKSLLRRYRVYKNKSSGRMLRPGIVLDEENRRVLLDGAPLELTETEFSILQCLAQNRGRVVPVRTIYETVWHETYMPASNNTVMVHIVNLRKKLEEDPANPRLIRTVWGKGYQID